MNDFAGVRRTRHKIPTFILAAITLFALLGAWWVESVLKLIPDYFLPSPSEVAAELVAARRGIGFMIESAAQALATDVVVVGIIVIAVIAVGLECLIRLAERIFVPWKGKLCTHHPPHSRTSSANRRMPGSICSTPIEQ